MKKLLGFAVLSMLFTTNLVFAETQNVEEEIIYERNTTSVDSSARSARSATAPTSARSARSATAKTTARGISTAPTSARSARSVSSAPATSVQSGRSARGVATAPTSRSARGVATAPTTGRSARTGRAMPTSITSSTVRTARGRTMPTSTRARAGVSRAGISGSVPVATTPATATTTTESTLPINYAALIPTELETKGKSAEEVATLLANENACKEQYVKCMDTLCSDTTEGSKVGRCLCSASISAQSPKEKELNKLLANVNQMTWQTKNLETAKAKAEVEGKDFAIALQEVTEKALSDLGVTGKTSASDSDITEIFLGEVSNKTVRKEGNAKLKEAQTACQTMLEICPASKKQIQDTYSILAGNDCRVYANDIDTKIKENTIILQNAYNQYQMKDTEYSLGSRNKFNAEQCGVELNRCMRTEELCGVNLEHCYSDAELEARKPTCQSVLNQCQGVNMPTLKTTEKRTEEKTDVLWKSFKKSVLSKSQLTNQQCFEQSKTCVIAVCGEDFTKCASGTIQTKGREGYIADIKKMAEAQCNDITKKCPAENNAWERIINEVIIKDVFTDVADETVYANLSTCMQKYCGENFMNCRNNATMEATKPNCLEGLMKATRGEEIWARFKSATLEKTGYTKAECSKMITDELATRCGAGYYDCRATHIDNYKSLAIGNAMSKCDMDVETLWKDIKTETLKVANKTASDMCALKTGVVYDETTGVCGERTEYTECKNKGGVWDDTTKVCSCTYGVRETGICKTSEEFTAESNAKAAAELELGKKQEALDAALLAKSRAESNLEAETRRLEGLLTKDQTDLKTAEDELALAKIELGSLKTKKEQAEIDLTTANNKITTLTEAKEQAETDLEEARENPAITQAELDELEEAKTQAENDLKAEKGKITKLEEAKTQAENDLKAEKDKLLRLNQELTEAKEALKKAPTDAQIKALEKARDEAKADILTTQTALSTANTAKEKAEKEVEKLKCDIKKGTFNATTNACSCPAGTTETDGVCRTVNESKCVNSTGTWANNQCYCPADATLSNGQCILPVQLPGQACTASGGTWDTRAARPQCRCTGAYTNDGLDKCKLAYTVVETEGSVYRNANAVLAPYNSIVPADTYSFAQGIVPTFVKIPTREEWCTQNNGKIVNEKCSFKVGVQTDSRTSEQNVAEGKYFVCGGIKCILKTEKDIEFTNGKSITAPSYPY